MTLRLISDDERRMRVARRHLLLPRERLDDAAAIADALVALHASDPTTVFLSIAMRMNEPSVESIEAALYEQRTLIRHHAMRSTLWVMSPDVARAAHASSTRKVAAVERRKFLARLAESEHVENPEVWLDDAFRTVTELVAERGSISTREIGQRCPWLRIPVPYPGPKGTAVELPAHTRVMLLAGFEGLVVRTHPTGSWTGTHFGWAPMGSWHSSGIDTLDTRSASATLIHRWLARFGPGTEIDLRWWTGWTKRQVVDALGDVGAQEVQLDSGGSAWVNADDVESPETMSTDTGPWVALLPGLDPTSMGWKERTWYLDADVAARTFDRNGNVGPTIWADGRIVGGWAQGRDGQIRTEIQRHLTAAQRDQLDDEIQRVVRFVGPSRFKVRFPSPNQKDLT